MRTLTPTTLALLLVTAACPGSGDDSTHSDTGHGETAAHPTTSGTTGHATHDTHAEAEHGETAHEHTETAGETAHEHTEATHGATDHGETDEHATTASDDPFAAYCFCMLENCHDQYHATWGEEHPQSEEMCLAAATQVPTVGMPAESGDSIECRMHFCALGHDDPAACDIALGNDPCQ